PQLQGRLLRQRGGDDHRLPAGRQEQDAAHRLLLRPAVAPERDQARPGEAARVHAGLKKVACDYPPYILNKIVRTDWMNSGGAAATFIKNFQWGNKDQNEVAD